MRTITVTVDDAVYERVQATAAERAMSVAAMVEGLLAQIATATVDPARLKAEEREIRERIVRFAANPRLSRDEVHDRAL